MSSAHEQIEIAGPTPQRCIGEPRPRPFRSMRGHRNVSLVGRRVPKLLRDIPRLEDSPLDELLQVPPVTRSTTRPATMYSRLL